MWPWGHLAVGYLVYVAYTRRRATTGQSAGPLAAVALGTQFPDLVDKPLAWTFAVLPSGRSLTHSLLITALVLVVLFRVAARYDRRDIAVAFGIGTVSHSLADLGPQVLFGLLGGDLSYLQWTTYLLWPVYPAPPYPNDESFVAHFQAFALEPYTLFQFGLFGVAVAVWLADGAPGWKRARRTAASVVASESASSRRER